tara:strand:- start:5318 stop:5956 length:639 start_codon:yes stop_codon:yes gene_type:complete
MTVQHFTFNGFQENTYILSDDSKECIIVDPGCSNVQEQAILEQYIEENGLMPKKLVCTHFHIDHILGNKFVATKWNLEVEGHEKGLITWGYGEQTAAIYGFPYDPSPKPTVFLEEGDQVKFGNTVLDILFVPGHAQGHIALVNHASHEVIAGDVLFNGSIGRTDLPGGDYNTLEQSILTKLYPLPDDYVVYCGHGPSTTIGKEKASNPFVRA